MQNIIILDVHRIIFCDEQTKRNDDSITLTCQWHHDSEHLCSQPVFTGVCVTGVRVDL